MAHLVSNLVAEAVVPDAPRYSLAAAASSIYMRNVLRPRSADDFQIAAIQILIDDI